jgi:Fe2+/Zn2+ uptake regulation proteins
MKRIKYSRQRAAVKDFLDAHHDHPTADTIYEALRKTFPNISLGTIYRNLALLEELGQINKITSRDGADRYDAETELHNHFICRKCNCVLNLDMDSIDHIKDAAAKHFDGSIDSYVAHFFGTCSDCAEEAEG